MKIAGGLAMLLLLVHSTLEEKEEKKEKEEEKEDDSGDSRLQLPPGEDFLIYKDCLRRVIL